MSEAAIEFEIPWADDDFPTVRSSRPIFEVIIGGLNNYSPTENHDDGEFTEAEVLSEVSEWPIEISDNETVNEQEKPVEVSRGGRLDPLSQLSRDVEKFPLLKDSEVIELAKKMERGGAIAVAAREKMINSNLRLVISLARKYQSPDLELLDLIQEGTSGLITAVDKFDYRRGNKFGTHAFWWIRQSILSAKQDQSRTIRIPKHINERIRAISRATSFLTEELGRNPTSEEVMVEAGLNEDEFNQARQALAHQPDSLNRLITDGLSELGDFVPSQKFKRPESIVSHMLRSEALVNILDDLEPRDREILEQRYGLNGEEPKPQREVAKNHGIIKQRVSQIESRALKKLRIIAEEKGLEELLIVL